jgi:hypothetical protein
LLAWTDARDGVNQNQALLEASTDGWLTFSAPVAVSQPGDRANQPAITPAGAEAWLTYNAYLQPWQATPSMPRLELAVVRMATISGGFPARSPPCSGAPPVTPAPPA